MLACAALVPLASSIVSLLGAGPEATSHGIRYLTIAAFGLPAVVVMVAAQGVLRGHADYRRPFVVLMASNILNAVIEIPLVFWADLSITGSAVSTVIAQYVGAIWLVIIAKPHLRLGRRFSVQSAIVRDLLRVGSDLGVRVFSCLRFLLLQPCLPLEAEMPFSPPTKSSTEHFSYLRCVSMQFPFRLTHCLRVAAPDTSNSNDEYQACISERSTGSCASNHHLCFRRRSSKPLYC